MSNAIARRLEVIESKGDMEICRHCERAGGQAGNGL